MKYGLVETKKMYFSSAEAAEQIGVPVKVLHSWEKDFPDLKPKKNKAGKRVYTQADIETAKKIMAAGAIPCGCPEGPVKKATDGKTAQTTNNNEFLLKIRNDLLKNFLRIHRS
ncbi:MAG: MerR family transcriptional regulator [Fibromonadales bacterium]|nr:MerR family transcriptional regulator [Fibromonadales bacterium]